MLGFKYSKVQFFPKEIRENLLNVKNPALKFLSECQTNL